jgi:hypothetical protein
MRSAKRSVRVARDRGRHKCHRLLLATSGSDTGSERLYAKDPNWIATMLWRSEFRNALLLYIRKEKMTIDQAMNAIEHAEGRCAITNGLSICALR